MKKGLYVFLLLIGVSTIFPQSMDEAAFQKKYIEILEQYMQEQYKEAWENSEQLMNETSNETQVKKIRESQYYISAHLDTHTKDKPKKFDDGLIYFWINNMAYNTAVAATIPLIFNFEYDTVSTSALTLLGLGSGVAASILSMRNSSMTWGRAIAIDFWTLMGALNTGALSVSLFDNQTGILPNAVSPQDQPKVIGTMIDAFTLTARYLSVYMTRDKELSAGQYSLMLSSYGWAAAFTTFYRLTYFPYAHTNAAFNTHQYLMTSLIGDAAALSIALWYDRIGWSSEQVAAANLAGGIMLGTGSGLAYLDNSPVITNNLAVVQSLWFASGVYLGVSMIGREFDYARSVMLGNAYFWSSYISYLLAYDLSDATFAPSVLPPLISGVTTGLLNHYYPGLKWSSTRSWLVSLAGGIGMITGGLFNQMVGISWEQDLVMASSALWAMAGLSLGVIFTKNLDTKTAHHADAKKWSHDVMFALLPRVNPDKDLGLDIRLAKEF